MSETRARVTKEALLGGLRAILPALGGQTSSSFGDRTRRMLGERTLELVREAYLARAQGGTADGAGWKRLLPSTLKAKRAAVRRGLPANLPGFNSGRLYKSLTPGNPECILEVEENSVRVGTLVPYAEHYDAERPIWPAGWPRREADHAMASRSSDGLAAKIEEELCRLLLGAAVRAALLIASGGNLDGA